MHADTIRFDRFELQPPERRLLSNGQPVPLGARAFDVLLVLVQRAGSLVSKAELLDTVWTGLVVEEANLTVQVSSLRKVLGVELIATIPGRGYRFTGRTQTATSATAAAPTAASTPGQVPPELAARRPGPVLVGRWNELQRLSAALATPGCVTLAGPAGVGKTSLARATAAAWARGAVWVDLAPLTEGAQVLPALARALGQPTPPAAPSLLRALGQRLLVLDNAEHLIDAAAALVAELHEAEPALPLLVTCQLPLAVPGERVLRVEPLALGDGVGDGDGALALFIERARAADHRFVADAAAQPLLRAICAQLDGLPLAIEMAAARVPALGLKGLHQALEQRFAVLTRGARTAADRHRTLHAALDWSHALLLPEEQRLFRALGVFAGGFTLDLAVALGTDAEHDRWAVIDTLATLVDRSLVEADVSDPPRYRLLETMRAYALEQLAATGEEATVRLRHLQAMQALFTVGARSDGGAASARAEHDNVREAIAWALQHAPALALRLTPAVCEVSSFTSWRVEALGWLERCAPFADADEHDGLHRAAWYTERARQHLMGGSPQTRELAQRALAYCRDTGNQRSGFMALIVLLRLGGAEPTGDPVQDLADFEALVAEARALHDAQPERQPRSTVVLHGSLAYACVVRNEHERAMAHYVDELAAARRAGFTVSADAAESNIGAQLFNLGRMEEALAHAQALVKRLRGAPDENANLAYAWHTCLGAQTALGHHDAVRADAPAYWYTVQRYGAPQLACEWVLMLALEGRHAAAARLLGFLQRASERLGTAAITTRLEAVRRARTLAQGALHDAAWDAAVTEGREMDDAAAMACLGVHLEGAQPA